MNLNTAAWPLPGPLEVVGNSAHTRMGADPTGFVRDAKVWRAAYYSSGAAVLSVWAEGATLRAEAWGDGAAEALASVPDFVGLTDDATGFDPSLHPVVRDAAARRPGARLIRTANIFDAAVRAVIGQKVTSVQAKQSFQTLVRRVRTPAPLPRVSRRPLFMPPTPEEVLTALSGHGATTLGLDVKRAAALRQVAMLAHRFAALEATPPSRAFEVRAALESIPGIGVWTANEVTAVALGDPDAVSVGDFHLKNIVGFALTGAARSTDEEMLALLEPFRPHRARAVRMILLAGLRPPRYGPRMSVPDHVPLLTAHRPSRDAAPRSPRSRTSRRRG